MSHPLLFSHLPFTTTTSSSSFTLPSTTTQEHEEHPVHHAHLQALPDKMRHQESLWREDLQSDGNPRRTSRTVYEPLSTHGSPRSCLIFFFNFLKASTRNFGWILIHPRVSPFLLSSSCPRDQTRYLSRSPGWIMLDSLGVFAASSDF